MYHKSGAEAAQSCNNMWRALNKKRNRDCMGPNDYNQAEKMKVVAMNIHAETLKV